MNFWRSVLFLSLIFLYGCPGDDPEPRQKVGAVAGVVTDLEGNALSGVFVEAMGMAVPTDNEGSFLLEEVPVGEEVLIKFSKSGYATNYKSVPVAENQVSPISAALSMTSYDAMINSDQENDISFDGAKVSLPANALVDENGNPVSGSINAKATYFDPTGDFYYDVFPGDFTGISSNGEEGLLESYGFIDVSFTQNGEELNLAEGMSADITIPIPQELLANAPDPIPLFFFDEEEGRWIEEGSASIVNGKYVGTVTHFSSWNADFLNTDEICTIKGRVVDELGSPLQSALVVATGTDFSGGNGAYTNADGRFSMQIKSDASVVLIAQYTSPILGYLIGVSNPLFTITCSNGGMNDVGDIIIELNSTTPNTDTVWWDVHIKSYPVAGGDDQIDAWRIGKNGLVNLCENCDLENPFWESRSPMTSETLLGIHFIDRDNGWICGNNGTIFKTNNRGQNWQEVSLNTFGNDLYEVEFVGSQSGWMAGSAGSLWYTEDGGISWYQANQNFVQDLYGMDFVDTQNGWAAGRAGKIFHTSDGGRNWSEQNSGTSIDLYDVSFINKYYGWAVGLNGTMLYTEDGGNNWDPISAGYNEDFTAIDFFQPNFGVIVGSNGSILTSTNRGSSWSVEDIGQQELWTVDIHNDYGAIGGEGTSVLFSDLSFASVPDGWTQISSPATYDLRDVGFLNSNQGFIGGQQEFYSTNDGGLTWQTSNFQYGVQDIEVVDNVIYVAATNESRIFRSQDAGASWDLLYSEQGNFNGYFSKLEFVDVDHGWALIPGGDKFIYTADGGQTWQSVTGLPSLGLPDGLLVNDVEFTSQTTGYLTAYSANTGNGVFYSTLDGGQTWNIQAEFPAKALREMDFVNESIGYIRNNDGYMYKTLNQGISWELIHTNSPVEFEFINEHQAWGSSYWEENIYFTDDGGQTWKAQGSSSGPMSRINKVGMIDESTGIAVGDDGQIYRTEKGGF